VARRIPRTKCPAIRAHNLLRRDAPPTQRSTKRSPGLAVKCFWASRSHVSLGKRLPRMSQPGRLSWSRLRPNIRLRRRCLTELDSHPAILLWRIAERLESAGLICIPSERPVTCRSNPLADAGNKTYSKAFEYKRKSAHLAAALPLKSKFPPSADSGGAD